MAICGCHGGGAAAEPTILQVSASQNGETFDVAVDDEIDVELQTVGAGQYQTPTVSTDAVRFVGASNVTPPVPAGPKQLFQFEAVHGGRAQISIPHSGAAGDFTATVEVHD